MDTSKTLLSSPILPANPAQRISKENDNIANPDEGADMETSDEESDDNDSTDGDEDEGDGEYEDQPMYQPTVPVILPRRRYEGARNVRTVKDGMCPVYFALPH